MVAIDSSKFKTSNSLDRDYMASKIDKRQQQTEESVLRYLDLIETADRTSPTGFDVKTAQQRKMEFPHTPDSLEPFAEILRTTVE